MSQSLVNLIYISVGLLIVSFVIYRYKKEFSNKLILICSFVIAATIHAPGQISIWMKPENEYFINPILYLAISLPIWTALIFGFWKFYRYVAGRAESNGRSYLAFLVLTILFPLLMLIIVVVMDKNNKQELEVSKEVVQE